MKYVAMDIESTGVGMQCQVVEVGAVVDDLFAPDVKLENLPKLHFYIDWPILHCEVGALNIHRNTTLWKRLAEKSSKYRFVQPDEVWGFFYEWLAGLDPPPFNKFAQINVAGKNFGYFDANRLEQLPHWPGPYNGGESIWAHKFIDPGNLFWNPWEDTETLPNAKKVRVRCGLVGSVAHTALEDALDVVREMRVWIQSRRSRKVFSCPAQSNDSPNED